MKAARESAANLCPRGDIEQEAQPLIRQADEVGEAIPK
jgi:hypothetical protein